MIVANEDNEDHLPDRDARGLFLPGNKIGQTTRFPPGSLSIASGTMFSVRGSSRHRLTSELQVRCPHTPPCSTGSRPSSSRRLISYGRTTRPLPGR